MRLRDILVVTLMAGIFFTVYGMMLDTDNYSQYDTAPLHAAENGTAGLTDAVIGVAGGVDSQVNTFQDELMAEDVTSFTVVGANTWGILKYVITFGFLQDWEDVFFELGGILKLPDAIQGYLFIMLILTAVFTIIGAALKWRT